MDRTLEGGRQLASLGHASLAAQEDAASAGDARRESARLRALAAKIVEV